MRKIKKVIMMEDNLTIPLVKAPEPTKIYLGKEARMKLHRMGAKGMAVILFDEFWGPVFQYYYIKRSKLVSRLLENRAMPAELSIIGKYVREMVLKDGTRVLIAPFITRGQGRDNMNFILVELRENVKNKKRLLELLTEVASELNGSEKIDLMKISNVIRKKLIKKKNNAAK